MEAVLTFVHRLVRARDGQDLMEYGLLVALIAIVAMVVVGTVGNTINTAFWETFNSVIASAA